MFALAAELLFADVQSLLQWNGGEMALINRFSPLGNLKDLTTASQLDDWGSEVEHIMSRSVAGIERFTGRGKAQFADPSIVDMGTAAAQAINWKGFPASLAAQGFSDEEALKIADGFLQDVNGNSGRDVQDEYLEWYVQRDANKDVTRIDFTTEGPEYWDILVHELKTKGIIELYQKYYPDAQETDLFHGNRYNPDNVFNNTRGAMHLRQANNTLFAEVEIAAQSTLTYTLNGALVTDGGDLCRLARLGEKTRASDPTIAQTVNGIARMGSRISLLDPIGLYMDPPDFTGWVTPDGSNARALWTNDRGNPMTRGSLHSPKNFKLSDVKIAGTNINYGGQVAKLISVQLTGLATGPNVVKPTIVPLDKVSNLKSATQSFALLRGRSIARQSRTGR
jgi:hypothetical protein